jgi:Flp pilus assembly pilin Flp
MKQRKQDRRRKGRSLAKDTRGLTTVEYIIILCLIAVVGFAVWRKFGITVRTKVEGADSTIGTLPEESR